MYRISKAMKTPYIVYYLHYKDKEWREPAYGKIQDFSVCVMAENTEEASEKAREIASQNGPYVRIMGIATGREEWVDEEKPLGDKSDMMPLGGWDTSWKKNNLK